MPANTSTHTTPVLNEEKFESDIETAMAETGWKTVDSKSFNEDFDPVLALNPKVFVEFVKTSQPTEWQKYCRVYGAQAEKKIVERLDKVVRQEGLLRVIRDGFKDRGIMFHAMFRKPETDMNATAVAQYEANIFQVVRQLHYSPTNQNSIDIVLFVNGIPVVTEELKNQFTGQNASNAIRQYKFDRAGKERIFTFKERVLAHFAVDLTDVYVTTRLQGSATYFLPFNQGSGGAGNVGGKGNPANPNGYATSYLWKQVLTPDGLTEILFKYLHLEREEDENGKVVSEKMIFPRFHQLDVVTKLLADVRVNGSGQNYLIEHSAGSGKSNSIAWLAHRLSGLHDEKNQKVFQSVIIVTDRRVLDAQLQNTVYQFDHQPGVVQKIDQNSKQLLKAIEDGASIIITTLQKFPVIYKKINAGSKRFAVIVDEAHSSQTGNAARKLKYALADRQKVLQMEEEESELLQLSAQVESEAEANTKDDSDIFMDELASHGRQKNLSFFAFTATPKNKTLELFGTEQSDGSYRPFHTYSMRQAIEEGFILDVLQNYTTYRMYYQIAKAIDDNPEFDKKAGTRAVTNFETLHPHNIAQKAAVILDHFDNITRKKIGGHAKAMVVTSSRLHAIRYVQELRRQIKKRKMEDRVGVLVAFSGELEDKGVTYTEEKLNTTTDGRTIRETELPQAFGTDDYAMLVVAEKYQTGFDQPLLHTMFVDKELSGVKAVQTLSRLNRTAKGKIDTFILDFVNTADDIRAAFQPYYEEASLEESTDPNLAADLKENLMDRQVVCQSDYETLAELYKSAGRFSDKELGGKLQACLQPALERFRTLKQEDQVCFKQLLARFNRFYSFITQVVRDFDEDLLKFSMYARHLAQFLPKDASIRENVDDKVVLEFYKLVKDSEGAIELESTDDTVFKPATGSAGTSDDKELLSLAEIIDKINNKYGTEFTEMDTVLLQVKHDVMKDDKWANVALTNSLETFTAIFTRHLKTAVLNRCKMNQEFFAKILENESLFGDIMTGLMSEVYEAYRERAVPQQ